MRRAWLASLFLASLSACSGGGSEDPTSGSGTASGSGASGSAGGAGGAGGGAQGIACTGAPADPDLTGTWAAFGKLSVNLEGAPGGAITICPFGQRGEATMLLLVTLKTDPADPQKLAEVRANLCSIELPAVGALVGSCDPMSKGLVYTQITPPDALLAALPKVATAPVTGAISGKGADASVSFDRVTVTLGASAGGAMLPKWDDSAQACAGPTPGHTNICEMACVTGCETARDDDGDSYPAVTLDVCGKTAADQKSGVACHADKPDVPGATLQGRAFMAFQVDPKFTGAARSSCELTGTVDASVLYSILGADIYLAGSPVTVKQTIQSLPVFKVDPAESRFRMVRVDGKYGAPSFGVDPAVADAACATLRQRENEL